jgi:hypothetical protein
MADKMAGIDVHKKVLMVVVMDARTPQAMKPHQDAVIRLAEVPGLGIDSAQ